MPQLNTIAPKQLMRLIGTPDVPVIVDVRIADDVALHPHVIPTALKLDHDAFDAILAATQGHPSVIICHEGHKLSHGVAARLRSRGQKAEVLEGGAVAWAGADYPAIPLAKSQTSARWVTRARPKIDRIACGWLIRRFINQGAEILYVPRAEVIGVAQRFDAIPFDVADVALTHRGDLCTFDAMIADFGLSHPALERLASVVRAADTNTHDQSPEAAGLLALSVGLSRMCRDDVTQLETALPVYDALYRWARDGFTETHETDLGGQA